MTLGKDVWQVYCAENHSGLLCSISMCRKLGHIASNWRWDGSEFEEQHECFSDWVKFLSPSGVRSFLFRLLTWFFFAGLALSFRKDEWSVCFALPPWRRWLSSALLPSLEFELPGEVLAFLLLVGCPRSLGGEVSPLVPKSFNSWSLIAFSIFVARSACFRRTSWSSERSGEVQLDVGGEKGR